MHPVFAPRYCGLGSGRRRPGTCTWFELMRLEPLLLLDIWMPILNGLEVLERLANVLWKGWGLKVVVLSHQDRCRHASGGICARCRRLLDEGYVGHRAQ